MASSIVQGTFTLEVMETTTEDGTVSAYIGDYKPNETILEHEGIVAKFEHSYGKSISFVIEDTVYYSRVIVQNIDVEKLTDTQARRKLSLDMNLDLSKVSLIPELEYILRIDSENNICKCWEGNGLTTKMGLKNIALRYPLDKLGIKGVKLAEHYYADDKNRYND